MSSLKRLTLVSVIALPLIVFLLFAIRGNSPSSPASDKQVVSDLGNASNAVSLPDNREEALNADSVALDSLQAGSPEGNVAQQSSELDALRQKGGKTALSSVDVQSMELDVRSAQ